MNILNLKFYIEVYKKYICVYSIIYSVVCIDIFRWKEYLGCFVKEVRKKIVLENV